MNFVIERILITAAALILFFAAVKLFGFILRKKIKSASLDEIISPGLKPGKPTLLYFWTPDCSQCKWQEKYLTQAKEELNSEGKILNVRKINAYQEHEFASRLKVITVPTLVLLDSNGKIAAWNPGLTQKKKIIDLLSVSSN